MKEEGSNSTDDKSKEEPDCQSGGQLEDEIAHLRAAISHLHTRDQAQQVAYEERISALQDRARQERGK